MAPINPLVTGYIAVKLAQGKYDKLSSVNLDLPSPDSLITQCLIEEALSLVHQRGRDLDSFISSRPHADRSQNDIRVTLGHLEPHARPVDPALAAAARDVLPDLEAEIRELIARPPFEPFGQEDAHVLALARWFKSSFMKWVDPIPCTSCNGKTVGIGGAEPTYREREEGGGRVELHRCEACGTVVRFVRYGSPMTLLRERRGRCGEWAHLFYVILLVSGINARYVWNSEDHVWNEYWSTAAQHWVHVDSCEATVSKPLLYARGWGKKQAFCLAVGREGAEDVTSVYVDDWEDCVDRRRRKGWDERVLQRSLLDLTVRLRLQMIRHNLLDCEERDRSHRIWTSDEALRWQEAERQNLGGRISGPEDWRAARDELGEEDTVVEPSYTVVAQLRSTADAGSVQLLGQAERKDDTTVLTTRPDQVSGMFFSQPIDPEKSFRVRLHFRLTTPPGSQGADGIALVLSSEMKLGGGGFGLGYDGIGKDGDFAIEVDTFCSYDHAEDPEVPHVSLHSPPRAHHRLSITCTKPGAVPVVNDGRAYMLQAVYDGSSRTVTSHLDIPGEAAKLGLWTAVVPPPSGSSDVPWFVGVTAATGGLWQKQEVLSLTVDEIILEEPASDRQDQPT